MHEQDRSKNWRRSLSVLVLLASLGASMQAQAQPTDAGAEAKLHYEEGTKAYSLGEFPRAITEFKAAYNAKSDPVLLYNIAQSYRLSGDANQALFFYRSFLRNKPDAPGRRDVEKKIKDLEKQISDGKAEGKPGAAVVPGGSASTTPATTPSSPPSPSPSPSSTPPSSTPSTALSPPPAQGTGPASSAPVEPLPSSTAKPLPTEPPPASLLAPPVPRSSTKPEGVGPPGVSAALGPEPAKSSPLYTKWWFWTGVGVLALLGLGLAASARQKVPHDDFDGPYEIK